MKTIIYSNEIFENSDIPFSDDTPVPDSDHGNSGITSKASRGDHSHRKVIASQSVLGSIKVGSGVTISNEGKLDVNIVDDLASTSIDSALSANQGRVLNNEIDSLPTVAHSGLFSDLNDIPALLHPSDVVDDLTTGGTSVPLSAEQGKTLSAMIQAAMSQGRNRGAVINAIVSQSQTYQVSTNFSIKNAGQDYSVGEYLYVQGSKVDELDAIFVVKQIDENKGVTELNLAFPGSFSTDITGDVTPVAMKGDGLILNITTTQQNAPTLSDITDPKLNDFCAVLEDELRGNIPYVWIFADIENTVSPNWVRGYPLDPNQRNFVNNPIANDELATNSVTTVKIASSNVTKEKLENDVIASLSKADSAYQKPSTGIGIGDLEASVKSSLNKADSAYQKPSTGITSSDLATVSKTSTTESKTLSFGGTFGGKAYGFNDQGQQNLSVTTTYTMPTVGTVAITNNYADLTGKPVLATVATSGSYNDLSDKPSLFEATGNVFVSKNLELTVQDEGKLNKKLVTVVSSSDPDKLRWVYDLFKWKGWVYGISDWMIVRTKDGRNWVTLNILVTHMKKFVVWKNQLVLIGGSNELYWSKNGIDFIALAFVNIPGNFLDAVAGDNTFAISTSEGYVVSTTSVDFESIQYTVKRVVPEGSTGFYLKNILYFKGLFVTTPIANGYSLGYYSSDAINWSTNGPVNFANVEKITYGPNRLISVGKGCVSYSLDGMNWNKFYLSDTTYNYDIIYFKNYYIIGSENSNIKIFSDFTIDPISEILNVDVVTLFNVTSNISYLNVVNGYLFAGTNNYYAFAMFADPYNPVVINNYIISCVVYISDTYILSSYNKMTIILTDSIIYTIDTSGWNNSSEFNCYVKLTTCPESIARVTGWAQVGNNRPMDSFVLDIIGFFVYYSGDTKMFEIRARNPPDANCTIKLYGESF